MQWLGVVGLCLVGSIAAGCAFELVQPGVLGVRRNPACRSKGHSACRSKGEGSKNSRGRWHARIQDSTPSHASPVALGVRGAQVLPEDAFSMANDAYSNWRTGRTRYSQRKNKTYIQQIGGDLAVEEALESEGFKQLQREFLLVYDPAAFRLEEAVLEMIAGTEPRVRSTGLHALHHAFDAEWDRCKSFKPHRRKLNGQLYNSQHGALLQREFERFVCDFIAPHLQENMKDCRQIYFQSKPSVRMQPPSNSRFGYPHTDAMYFHQRGQINFWVPVTKVYDTNTLWVESKPGLQDYHPLELDVGQCARFYGNQCTHLTLANDTPDTRVSLDLRVVPGPCFDPDPPDSRNRNGRPIFVVGGYYAVANFNPQTHKWAVAEGTLVPSFGTDEGSAGGGR